MVRCGELPSPYMAITQSSIDKLKAAPLSKVIEEMGSKLKRVGHEFVTQCIWHEDTNPSLTINDDKGFCFCHVCRGGGDVIKYVQQRKGMSFPDAADFAASILGIRLETDGVSQEQQEANRKRKRETLDRLAAEQQGYAANLHNPKAGRIRQILKDRGLNKAAADEFELGYAPIGFFAHRITVPIYNHRSELVGWTGRATKDQPGKYKNSQDSDVFAKKTLVFNEARAKEAARLSGSLIFVEGHLDVVSLWQHGIANVVAMQGTGAPERYVLERLAKTVNNFVLCFDGDEGGKKAVQQFISAVGTMAQKGEIQISIAQLPEKKDPDEVCRESGPQAFHNLVADAMPWLDWVIDFWAAGLDKTNTAHVTAVERELRAIIDGLVSNTVRTHYIDKVARALSQDDKEARKVAKDWGTRSVPVEERQWVIRSEEKTKLVAERRLLRLFVHKPEHRDSLRPLISNVTHPPFQWLCERLQELEGCSSVDLTPHSVMAVVVVSEPHFTQQLRRIVQPNVLIDDSPGVLSHLHVILGGVSQPEPHELNSDQSSAF